MFLKEDDTLAAQVTPKLLGLDSYMDMCSTDITLLSEGYKGLCAWEVLKVLDPKQANYSRDIIAKYLELSNVEKWSFRNKYLLGLHSAYASEGIDSWGVLSIQATHYTKNESLKKT